MNNTFTEECVIEKISEVEYIPTKHGGDIEKRVVTCRFIKLNDHENRHPSPAYPEIQFLGGRCKYLSGLQPGDKVTVTFTFVTRPRLKGPAFTNIMGETIYKGYQHTGGNQ